MTSSRTTRALRASAVLLAGAVAVATGATAAPIEADPPLLVTGRSPLPAGCSDSAPEHYSSETEPSLAVSPFDSDVLVATWMQDASAAHPVARSVDGGRSWHTVVPPGLTKCTHGNRTQGIFDPWVSFGVDGRVYLSSPAGAQPVLGNDVHGVYNPLSRHIWVHVSDDQGRTWREPVAAGGDDNDGFILDKATITGDPVRPGVAYLTWARISPVGVGGLGFSRTSDGGRTWTQTRLPMTFPQSGGALIGSQIAVNPRTGELLLVTGDGPPQPGALLGQLNGPTRFYALRSSDGGATWSDAVLLGEVPQFPEVPTVAFGQDGTAYVAWASVSDDSGAVWVTSSRDTGATWTPPVIAAAPNHPPRIPQIAVDSRGAVGLTWMEDGGSLFGAVSYTRGRTWLHRVLTKRLDASHVPPANSAGGSALGDYSGLVALRAGFVSVASLPAPYAVHGPTDLYATRFGE